VGERSRRPRCARDHDPTKPLGIRLGGHIKNNGDPGWIVLGRGFAADAGSLCVAAGSRTERVRTPALSCAAFERPPEPGARAGAFYTEVRTPGASSGAGIALARL
jgi:hypothetical protein